MHPSCLPTLLKQLRQRLVHLPNAKRSDRMCDRIVKKAIALCRSFLEEGTYLNGFTAISGLFVT
jgi:hypothetical protein